MYTYAFYKCGARAELTATRKLNAVREKWGPESGNRSGAYSLKAAQAALDLNDIQPPECLPADHCLNRTSSIEREPRQLDFNPSVQPTPPAAKTKGLSSDAINRR